MAEKTIYSLLIKGTNEQIQLGETVPARIDVPGTGDVLMGAGPGWENDTLAIVSSVLVVEDPPAPRRIVLKSTIIDRLNSAGKITAAYQALQSNAYNWARWTASDKPAIYADDPDAIALLNAIGADPAEILA